ncbi:MAG: hypothetical protein KatS3mg004_2820 [Bryobacteraceae bacterium]|nr:MAG: hypothetical protein KatS3mg004_2820 [Bryobacteraceae bacterium]
MRYFDLESARALLPELRRLMREAMQARTELEAVRDRLATFAARAQMLGGVPYDADAAARWQAQLAEHTGQVRQAVSQITSLGVQVKDLEIGLVDFPTIYRGEEVLLCWRLDEPDIAWWHGMQEGYKGRKPVDGDFIARHRGQ